MTPLYHNTPAILRLPDEILSAIFELNDQDAWTQSYNQMSSLRLTCRRFCALCHRHVIRRNAIVDVSRPETLSRLDYIVQNPVIASGIREIYVRLHFYHSWVAANLQNFVSSVASEWHQRRQSWQYTTFGEKRDLTFQDIMKDFLEQLEVFQEQREIHETSKIEGPSNSTPRSIEILHQAYNRYKRGFEAQDRWLSSDRFTNKLAETLSRLPNIRQLILHDGELNNNYDPGTNVNPVDAQDTRTQNEILVGILSRPMLWEDVRWIIPSQQLWGSVPIHFLLDIPLAVGKVRGLILDHLSIELSAAPDYTLLQLDDDILDQLSASAESFELFQFTFQPRCRSGCGPWLVDDGGIPVYAERQTDELYSLNQYLGAIIRARCVSHANINLGEFWFSAGVQSVLHAPTSLGAGFAWPLGSDLGSLSLTSVGLTNKELEALAKSLLPESELELSEVHLRVGTWRDALDILRRDLRDPLRVCIRFPLGDELEILGEERVRFVFHYEESSSKKSRAERFAEGENIENPFQTSM